MNPIIIQNQKQLEQLCKIHQIKQLFAFGSVCTSTFTETSDIDLLVAFLPMEAADYADNYFVLADKLEALFNRPVDLVTDKSLKNPYFITVLNKTKTLLYES